MAANNVVLTLSTVSDVNVSLDILFNQTRERVSTPMNVTMTMLAVNRVAQTQTAVTSVRVIEVSNLPMTDMAVKVCDT